MAWGDAEGERLKEDAKLALGLLRMGMYSPNARLWEIARELKHVDKSTELKRLLEQLDSTMTRIELLLSR